MLHSSLIILTPYPQGSVYSDKESALASFSKNLVTELRTKLSLITVITNARDKSIFDSDGNVQIERCWKKNALNSFAHILHASQRTPTQNMLIQLEWNMFGQPASIYMLLLPFLLLGLRLIGKKVVVVAHGVLLDASSVLFHSPFVIIQNVFLRLFYICISLCSERIVVLEQALKDELVKIGIPWTKVAFIPHGIDTQLLPLSQNEAHARIHADKRVYVVCPGFINRYKGTDIFAELAGTLDAKKYQCIIAGGESFNLGKTPDYRMFADNVKKIAAKNEVQITGFLDQNDLVTYLSAADILIFPYRSLLSSSGVLSLGITFEKPFLLSEKLRPYIDSSDFGTSLHESGLNENDIFFSMRTKSLAQQIDTALQKKDYFDRFAQLMQKRRSWRNVSQKYLKVLFS
jgi:glycosyltransferase involved in cell wall biosynthesis